MPTIIAWQNQPDGIRGVKVDCTIAEHDTPTILGKILLEWVRRQSKIADITWMLSHREKWHCLLEMCFDDDPKCMIEKCGWSEDRKIGSIYNPQVHREMLRQIRWFYVFRNRGLEIYSSERGRLSYEGTVSYETDDEEQNTTLSTLERHGNGRLQ